MRSEKYCQDKTIEDQIGEVNLKQKKICLACAHIYKSDRVEEIICPRCGYKQQAIDYEKFMERARKAVYYGWYYRRYCDERQWSILTHEDSFNAMENENLAFLALSVLSVKKGKCNSKTGWKIQKSVELFVRREGDYEAMEFFDRKKKMKKFRRYITEYSWDYQKGCERNFGKQIMPRVLIEIRVGEDYSKEYKKYTDDVRKERQTMDFDREYTPESEISWESQKKIEKELKEAEDKLRIEKEMFQGLWSRL